MQGEYGKVLNAMNQVRMKGYGVVTPEENGIWDTNIFGKSIEQIVEDGIQAKISQMTEDCQSRLQDALQKIINDSNGGMICIII